MSAVIRQMKQAGAASGVDIPGKGVATGTTQYRHSPAGGLAPAAHSGPRLGAAALVAQQESSDPPTARPSTATSVATASAPRMPLATSPGRVKLAALNEFGFTLHEVKQLLDDGSRPRRCAACCACGHRPEIAASA
jgi:hypothetical protein